MIKKARIAIWFLLLVPYQVLAAKPEEFLPSISSLPTDFKGGTTVGGVITQIILVVLSLAGLIAVGMLIYGGFQYITARGDEGQAENAKKTITNSIIGLIVILLSYIIIRLVVNAAFGGIR